METGNEQQPTEPLPTDWKWERVGGRPSRYHEGTWTPVHGPTGVKAEWADAGKAWLMEATGLVGPHFNSSKVNLAPADKEDPIPSRRNPPGHLLIGERGGIRFLAKGDMFDAVSTGACGCIWEIIYTGGDMIKSMCVVAGRVTTWGEIRDWGMTNNVTRVG